jgi:hypothetical protein
VLFAQTKHGTASRRLTALALGLWLSGMGCLLCCERPASAAHDVDARAVSQIIVEAGAEAEVAAHAASAEHSCCKARVGSGAKKARGEGPAARKARPADSATRARARAGLATERAAREQTARRHSCCRRAVSVSEQARKPDAVQPPAPSPSNAAPPARPAAAETFIAARPRAPDRAGTYLRCRVLLI